MNLNNKILVFASIITIGTASTTQAAWTRSAKHLLKPAVAIGTANYLINKNNSLAQASDSTSSSNDTQNENTNSNTKLLPVFSEELVDKWLDEIGPKATTAEEIKQKRKLFESVVFAITGRQIRIVDNFEANNFFKPVCQEKFTVDEAAQSTVNKGKKTLENLEKIYKGPIPSQVKDMAEYYADYDNNSENKIPNYLLLHGVPGTGKTHLVESFSQAAQIPYFSFPAALLTENRFDTESCKIKKAFAAAKDFKKPVILFIDEIDAIAATNDQSTNEHKLLLSIFLNEVRNIQNVPHVFVIVATSDKASLNRAMLDTFSGATYEVKPLNIEDKEKLLEKLCQDHNVQNYAGYPKALAHVLQSNNFSNRDLRSIVITARFKQYIECKKDSSKCQEPMHKYFRKAIDEAGKDAKYKWRGTFGSGI